MPSRSPDDIKQTSWMLSGRCSSKRPSREFVPRSEQLLMCIGWKHPVRGINNLISCNFTLHIQAFVCPSRRFLAVSIKSQIRINFLPEYRLVPIRSKQSTVTSTIHGFTIRSRYLCCSRLAEVVSLCGVLSLLARGATDRFLKYNPAN